MTTSKPKMCWRIVHYASVIIPNAKIVGVPVLLEVMMMCLWNIIPENCDVIVTVPTILFVIESDSVHEFVQDGPVVHAAFSERHNLWRFDEGTANDGVT